jgi:predicted nucleic acid-binding protein
MSARDERFFFDTNLLMYWLDSSDRAKHQAARRWVAAVWERDCGAISWQVLNEFYTNAMRKLKAPHRVARTVVEAYAEWKPATVELALVRRAWHWMDDGGVSWWDALILAAAEAQGCRYLVSEDFQAGRKFGTVQVVNPFEHGPEEFFR